jgi:hypothetical protein
MRRISILLFFTLVFIIGCNGALHIQAPELKAVIMEATSVTVFWEQNSVIESNADFVGYNIYVYTDSSALLVESGEELNKYNSLVIHDTVYQVNGLVQDSIYYFQVRTMNADAKVGDYNSVTPFIKASPRPEFTVTVKVAVDTQTVNDSCAVRFADALIMADSTMPDSGADMWVGTVNDTVMLRSPNSHGLYGANARVTYFVNTGPGDFDSLFECPVEPDEYTMDFSVGDVGVAKTEDGNYVKIFIESIDPQDNSITVKYAYQNIVGFPYF